MFGVRRTDATVRPYGWIRLRTGENGTRGARHTTIGSVNASGGRVTVVVDVTGSGNEPGIGWRLRTLAVRVLVGIGLAAVAWLLGAALSAGTASAAEPSLPTLPSTGHGHASNGLLGSLVGTVTGTVGNLVGDTTTTTTTVVKTVDPPPATPPKQTPKQTPKPSANTKTTQKTTPVAKVVPVAVVVPPTTAVVPRAVHRTLVVPTRREAAVRTQATTSSVTPHRRFIETRAPHPAPAPAPLAPSPDVPVTVVSAGHSTGHLARAVIATDVPGPAVPTQVSPGGWRADPATLAARCQCLPATSPD